MAGALRGRPIVKRGRHLLAVEIDLEHAIDRFAADGKLIECGLKQAPLDVPADDREPRRGITGALRSGRSTWGELIAPHKKHHRSLHVEMCDPDGARVENRPAFRKAFERRRCLVPVDNF